MIVIQMAFYLYFGDTYMTNVASNATAAKSETTVETKQVVLTEIRAKWGKFSEQDLSALKGNDDLVTQLVAKYGLEKVQAQRDVDALMKGRRIWRRLYQGEAVVATARLSHTDGPGKWPFLITAPKRSCPRPRAGNSPPMADDAATDRVRTFYPLEIIVPEHGAMEDYEIEMAPVRVEDGGP
jgi:hypothetical protein